MNLIDKINKKQINPNVPEFRVGDTVRVDVRIKEGKRERRQRRQRNDEAKRRGKTNQEESKLIAHSSDIIKYCATYIRVRSEFFKTFS